MSEGTGVLCTFCQKHPAVCHLTKLVSGKVVDLHVCEYCIPEIKEKDLLDFDVWEAVGKLAAKLGMPDPLKAIEPPEAEEITAKSLLMEPESGRECCPQCGFTGEDLRKVGRLGCPHCYEVFGDMLADVIKDCQKGGSHVGKVPKSKLGLRRRRLEDALETAVREERFEEAAVLRDQIRSLVS
jgi:protein arginine kinase activator